MDRLYRAPTDLPQFGLEKGDYVLVRRNHPDRVVLLRRLPDGSLPDLIPELVEEVRHAPSVSLLRRGEGHQLHPAGRPGLRLIR